MMMFSSGDEGGTLRRIDDDPPAAEALAEVIVGVAFEFERHALGHERAEALAGAAVELELNRVLGRPFGPHLRVTSLPTIVPTTRCTLRIGRLGADLLAALDGRLAQVEQHRHVERLLQTVILVNLAIAPDLRPDFRLVQNVA